MDLPENVVALLRTPALCYVAAVMPSGSPQLKQTAVAISHPTNPAVLTRVRGQAVTMTSEGGEESINALAHRQTGQPSAWYGDRKQTRLLVTVRADRTTSVPQAAVRCRNATAQSARHPSLGAFS